MHRECIPIHQSFLAHAHAYLLSERDTAAGEGEWERQREREGWVLYRVKMIRSEMDPFLSHINSSVWISEGIVKTSESAG